MSSRRRIPPGELVDAVAAPLDELRHHEGALDRLLPIAAVDPVQVREDEQVLLDRQGRVQVVELRRHAQLRTRLLRLPRELEPKHLDLALVRDRLGREEPHRRRFPGAIRTKEPDAGSHRHVQVEAVDGGDLAVALDGSAEADGEVRRHRPRMPISRQAAELPARVGRLAPAQHLDEHLDAASAGLGPLGVVDAVQDRVPILAVEPRSKSAFAFGARLERCSMSVGWIRLSTRLLFDQLLTAPRRRAPSA